MRLQTLVAAGVLGLAGPVLLALPAARAAPATDVTEVVRALGLNSEPADYVVLADTSGSMKAGGRYTSMRRELGKLVDSLEPDDRVSLVTFDSKATSRFRGLVGRNKSVVLAGLPVSAAGLHTDIGAAIDAGLTALEGADTHRLAALILITDGKLDAPGSDYASVKSAAWRELAARANALQKDHQVAAYAVSLQATTDAGLLKNVFPQASEVDAAEVGTRFSEVGGDLLRLQAANVLKDEVAQDVQVTWTGDLGASLANGRPVEVQLEFASPYPHVPVELTDLRAAAPEGLHVELTGLPASLELEPGGRATVKGQALVTGSTGGDAKVNLAARVSSPWSKAIESDLGLTFAPGVSGSATVPPVPITLPATLLPTLAGIAALVLVALLVLLAARMLLTPTMGGILTFRKDGREVGEIVVTGRRMKLGAPVGATELNGLTGSVIGTRGASGGKERAVRLDARFGTKGARGIVSDGGSLELGELEVCFTSGRRRILDKIGVSRPAD